MCEGVRDSIDSVFINKLMNTLRPSWLRPWKGSNVIRINSCGGRRGLIEKLPAELRSCLQAGGATTLMVWADCDDDCADGEALKEKFWQEAQRQDIRKTDFDLVVFIFAKDRLENWIEYLQVGQTDESKEGPRIIHNRIVAEAASALAKRCQGGKPDGAFPQSLQWSCKNWRALTARMK
jgi:hypothetical protein